MNLIVNSAPSRPNGGASLIKIRKELKDPYMDLMHL
jgi:hypothetical protein